MLTLYIRNINSSINEIITCSEDTLVIDLKKEIGSKIKQNHIYFNLIYNNQKLNPSDSLSNYNIPDQSTLFLMGVLNKERAILEEWFRVDGTNWVIHDNWNSNEPLNTWYGITTNEEGKVVRISFFVNINFE